MANIAVGPSASAGNAILRTDGSVWEFADEIGQLTTQVTTIGTDVVTLAAGQQRLCAIKRDGSVWCWGVGYLGDNHDAYPATDPQDPKPVTLPMTATALEAGVDWTCASLSDGSVWCWGSTGYGSGGPVDTTGSRASEDPDRRRSPRIFHGCFSRLRAEERWKPLVLGAATSSEKADTHPTATRRRQLLGPAHPSRCAGDRRRPSVGGLSTYVRSEERPHRVVLGE